MSRKSLCCIAPSPAYVRRGCLALPINYGSSSSSSQPRTSRCGIQSLYFRTGVTEVLARVVLQPMGMEYSRDDIHICRVIVHHGNDERGEGRCGLHAPNFLVLAVPHSTP